MALLRAATERLIGLADTRRLPLASPPDVDATVPPMSSACRRAPDDRQGVSFQVLLHPAWPRQARRPLFLRLRPAVARWRTPMSAARRCLKATVFLAKPSSRSASAP